MSFALYSGNLDRADVFIGSQAAERLPHDLYETSRQRGRHGAGGLRKVHLD